MNTTRDSEPKTNDPNYSFQALISKWWEIYDNRKLTEHKITRNIIAKQTGLSKAVVGSMSRSNEKRDNRSVLVKLANMLKALEQHFPGFMMNVFFDFVPQKFVIRKEKDYQLSDLDLQEILELMDINTRLKLLEKLIELNSQELLQHFLLAKVVEQNGNESLKDILKTNFNIRNIEPEKKIKIVEAIVSSNGLESFSDREYIHLKKGRKLEKEEIRQLINMLDPTSAVAVFTEMFAASLNSPPKPSESPESKQNI